MPKSNRNCAVGGCSHTQKTCPKGRFVGFPNEDRQPERRALWIKLVQRGSHWIPTKNSRVCGCHFSGGYKVDDPNDPAYNPSIFPPMPELDRRVRKTLIEEMCRRKVQDGQAVCDMSFDLPLPLPTNQTNNSNGFVEFGSTALDLSKVAEEDTQPFNKVLKSDGKLRANGTLTRTGCKKTVVKSETLPRVTTTAELTSGSRLSTVTSHQLTTSNQLTKVGSTASSNPGWVYINQSRLPHSLVNLTQHSLESAPKRRRLSHPNHKQQTPVRLQKYQSTNRKFSGNLGVTKNPRSLQMRHFSRTAGSVDMNRSRATDLSIASLEQNAKTSARPHNRILSNLLTNPHSKEVQTVLSMPSQAEGSTLSAYAHGRCVGFHGWSDICFSRITVMSMAGVTPEVFDLLLGQLPEVMPGLPAHNSLLLFLMKLKMNVPFEFLSNVFGITATTAFNIFSHVLSVLVAPLSDLIQWPSDTLKDSMPQDSLWSFIPKFSIIIDCLSIQTEFDQLEMVSSKTGTCVIKILTGLHPSGSVCSVSHAYSDCAINNDLLTHLRLPDSVEKGSRVLLLQQDENLYQSLTAKGFIVLAPPFLPQPIEWKNDPSTCSKSEEGPRTFSDARNESESSTGADCMDLSVSKVKTVDGLLQCGDGLPVAEVPSYTSDPASCPQPQETLNTATIGIYAGKMSQKLRSFSILVNTLESKLLPLIDDVVCVCAALNNLQEPIT